MLQSIEVGARDSPLSRCQVKEIYEALRIHYPDIVFNTIYVKTTGDHDQTTSLRTLDKTDFFTREIDQMLLEGKCRIAIHSAKDLPDPLSEGLEIVALTKSIDPSDSLVLREGESHFKEAIIATSSLRREEMVKKIIPDARFVDIRGNIGERLAKLEKGEIDGVVVAEAALIRLGLTHLYRVGLPGETASLQGRLAVVARVGDFEVRHFFAFFDLV